MTSQTKAATSSASRVTHREWITERMAAAVNAFDSMTHDEIKGLSVDAYVVGFLLAECDHMSALQDRLNQLRGIADSLSSKAGQ